MDINKPKNIDNLSNFERLHVPFVEVPYNLIKGSVFELRVRVGEIMHAMEEEHFITGIELHHDDRLIEKITLGPQMPPKCVFNTVFEENTCFRIVAVCNLHGMWERVVCVRA